MNSAHALSIDIFYDGVNIDKYGDNEMVSGFTTNPTLMKCGLVSNDYKEFADQFLKKSKNLPVSFEVFADDDENMIKQARIISKWSPTIYIA